MENQNKKTVLITGASRGIGRAIADAFAKEQYQLVLNCHSSGSELNAYAASLEKTYGCNCLTCIGDVSSPSFIRQMFEKARDRFGGIDVLINNAGISHIGLLHDMTDEQWHRILNTNLSSVFYCSREAVPYMIHQKNGRIINISSVWGVVGASCEVAYSATKGAVNSFTMALAKELAPSNIPVNAIACGTIDTAMNSCFSVEERHALEEEIPCGRYGTPQEVAALALSLATSGSYLTGQIIRLDGGWI